MSIAYLFPSALFQMLPSENLHYRRSQLHEVKHDIAEVGKGMKTDIVEVRNEMKADNTQLKADIDEVRNEMKADNTQLKADIAGVRKDLEVIVSREVEKLMSSLEAKLDVALAKSSEK